MKLFLQYKKIIFIGILIITALGGVFVKNILPADFNFEGFFPKNESFDFYQNYRNTFSRDDNVIFISLENPDGTVMDSSFLHKAESIFKTISTFDYLDTLISPFEIKHYVRTPGGTKGKPYIDYSSSTKLLNSDQLLNKSPDIKSVFISKSGNYISSMAFLNPEFSDGKEKDELVKKLETLEKDAPGKMILTGIPYIRSKYIGKINSETGFFIITSMLFIILVLTILYWSYWGVIIPVCGVLVALLWTLGLQGALNRRIDIMSNIIPTIILVVGIAGIIHLITHYIQEVQDGKPPLEAMGATLKSIGVAIFLTCLSTAIGFTSLSISPQPPIRFFGLITGFGVMITFLVIVGFIPSLVLRIPINKIKSHRGLESRAFWDVLLGRINKITQKNRTLILLVLAGLLIFSGVGISKLSFNSYLLDEIKESDPVRQGMFFFEKEYNGIRPFEMAIIPKNKKKSSDIEILKEIDKIENYLLSQADFSPFFSLSSFIKNANKTYHFDRDKFYKLPSRQEKVDEILGFAISSNQGEIIDQLVTKDRSMTRISARMPDLGTDKLEVLRINLEKFIVGNCNTDIFDFRITGSSFMTEMNINNLRSSLFSSLLLAFVLIGLLMGWLFKSWRMLVIALIPNLIPLLFTAGLMGMIGLSLKSSTSIVFIISFGIAVDDTIHFLSRLSIELKEGKALETAIKNTLHGTGKALILTTMILASGFFLFVSSDFEGTFTVGLFVLISLILGLLSDLFLLPVLVRIGLGNKKGNQE